MSLQDDIFDVQAALKGKSEAKQFERIYDYICEIEAERLRYQKVINKFIDLEDALKEWKDGI